MRIDPPPSVPMWKTPMPRAAAAAAPPLDPPAVLLGSQGLAVAPKTTLSVVPFQPNSGELVFPISTAPASRSRATVGASSSEMTAAPAREHRRSGQPLAASNSLTVAGTPSAGPNGSPLRHRDSDARAASSAPSRSRKTKALTAPFSASIRANTASVTVTGDRLPKR